ncbi:phosphatase domain-containing protein [Granulicoccus phenolivorans]|uniref:phosphatase domain-containing protein n=1 Tax=Granulicoccus phenolivorans TaxID=266854 RepID=UPI0004217A45|nr:phosphatase domain-containing protein [Granulicoccus phenolivorans]
MTPGQRLRGVLSGPAETRERAVLDLIESFSADELNQALAEVLPRELLSALEERWFGPDQRGSVIHALVHRRRELSMPNQVALIHAMQLSGPSRVVHGAITELLLGFTGLELTEVKNRLNNMADHVDLEDLVFGRLDSAHRRRVLDHFAVAAREFGLIDVKVLSDIDDTVISSVLARTFPRGTVYPGALAFLEALDRGPIDQPFTLGDLTFVTARPADALGLVEGFSRQALRAAGVSRMSFMGGSVLGWLSTDAIGRKKLQNIQHYRQLFPEYRLVWVGDTRQADLEVGQRLLVEAPDQTAGVFIHDVSGIGPSERMAYARTGLYVFDTYIGAADAAHRRGLISLAGRDQVIREALGALVEIDWPSQAAEHAAQQMLDRDLAALPAPPSESSPTESTPSE